MTLGLERLAVAHVTRKEESLQFSHIDWSQHGSRKALMTSLLQIAHLSLMGISSWEKVLSTSQHDEIQHELHVSLTMRFPLRRKRPQSPERPRAH